MADNIEWTADEIADLLNENIDKIMVFNPWNELPAGALENADFVVVNGDCVQININLLNHE